MKESLLVAIGVFFGSLCVTLAWGISDRIEHQTAIQDGLPSIGLKKINRGTLEDGSPITAFDFDGHRWVLVETIDGVDLVQQCECGK